MKVFLVILVILLILAAAVVVESYRELRQIRLTRYAITDKSIPAQLKGKSLVFLSDYHEAVEGALNDRIIGKIDSVKPAAILLGGDMLNGKNPMEDITPAADLITGLAGKYPIYYAFGNHERKVKSDYYDTKQLWEEFTEKIGDSVHFLQNESVSLDSIGLGNVTLYGLDIPLEYYARISYPKLDRYNLSGLLGVRKPGEYSILLAHTPDFIDGYADWDADLVLSGHFHGGLVRLPLLGGVVSPRLRLFPKYDYGRFKKGDTTMIVTNGIGQHSLKIRIGNIPEIVVLDFK